MTFIETISVFIFLGTIAVVYILEAVLVWKFVADKLRGKKTAQGRMAGFVHLAALIGILCFLYGYFVEPFWLEVKTVDIFTDKLKNTELKVVQISDLHCDERVLNEYKMVKIINELKPDIIVFTGDSLNSAAGLGKFREVMKALEANIGKYAAQGNVDVIYFGALDLFAGTGFEELDKNSVELIKNGERFFVSGLSYAYPEKYRDALSGVPQDSYSIFLRHYPDLAQNLEELNVDLYLAGHTHGGQIRLPFYGAIVTFSKYGKKYEAGKYSVGKTTLYINRGLGLEGGFSPRVRFLTRPEITVFNLKPKR